MAAGRWLVARAAAQQVGDAGDDSSREPGHPLDPLSADEIQRAVAILRKEQGLGDSWRFVTVTLAEPARETVATHVVGEPFERLASAVVLDTATGEGRRSDRRSR